MLDFLSQVLHDYCNLHDLEHLSADDLQSNTEIKQKEIRHPYLKKAITLRKSGNDFEAS